MTFRNWSRTLGGAALAAFLLSAISSAAEPAGKELRLKVLFLGDQGHHRPSDRAPQIIPVLATRGIDITYTEAMSDLNPQTLAKYDVLMIYANTTRIEPDQEKALLDYVENGGGFAPIHCASYCFLNSPKYIALVGAQFKSHGTGVFDTKVIDPGRPHHQGLDPVRDLRRNLRPHQAQHQGPPRPSGSLRRKMDRRALDLDPNSMAKVASFTRLMATTTEPGTNPGFQDLIERGLRWAVKQRVRSSISRPRVAERSEAPFSLPSPHRARHPPVLYRRRYPGARMAEPIKYDAA